jgi:hypothetical protein
MRQLRRNRTLGGFVVSLFAGLLLLGIVNAAQAQPRIIGTAEVRRVAGQVEVLRKGQTQWTPVVVGARLEAGDDLRAYGASSAELAMPDGSTLLLAENSRVFVTKLDFDTQNQTRVGLFHVVVGKVKAVVAQAAITLVRARQSNFTISTPTAVAAARGTAFVVDFDEIRLQMLVAVLVEDPQKPFSIVSCTALRDRFNIVLVGTGLSSTGTARGCTPPVPIFDPDIDSMRNPRGISAAFFGPANPVPSGNIPGLVSDTGILFTSGPDVLSPIPPTLGRDTTVQPIQTGSTSPTNR